MKNRYFLVIIALVEFGIQTAWSAAPVCPAYDIQMTVDLAVLDRLDVREWDDQLLQNNFDRVVERFQALDPDFGRIVELQCRPLQKACKRDFERPPYVFVAKVLHACAKRIFTNNKNSSQTASNWVKFIFDPKFNSMMVGDYFKRSIEFPGYQSSYLFRSNTFRISAQDPISVSSKGIVLEGRMVQEPGIFVFSKNKWSLFAPEEQNRFLFFDTGIPVRALTKSSREVYIQKNSFLAQDPVEFFPLGQVRKITVAENQLWVEHKNDAKKLLEKGDVIYFDSKGNIVATYEKPQSESLRWQHSSSQRAPSPRRFESARD